MTARWRSVRDALGFGLVAKAAGFAVPIAVAAAFGSSTLTDAFYVAYAYVSVLLAMWAQAFEQFCIPLFVRTERDGGSASRLAQLTRVALPYSAASLLVAWMLAAAIGAITGAPHTRLVFWFLACLAPQALAAAAAAVPSAYLLARGEYRWTSVSYVWRAIGALAGAAFAPDTQSLEWLAAGYCGGELMRCAALWYLVRRIRPNAVETAPSLTSDELRRGALHLGSVAVLGLAPLLERQLSALMPVGSVTALEFASKLFYMTAAAFDTGFVAVFLTAWAAHVQLELWSELRRDLSRSALLVGLIAAGVTVVAFVWRAPIVSLLFERGSFPVQDATRVAAAFGVLLIGLPAFAIGVLLTGALIALDGQGSLVQLSIGKMVLRATLAVWLGQQFGLNGLALALPLTAIAELVWLWRRIRREVNVRESRHAASRR